MGNSSSNQTPTPPTLPSENYKDYSLPNSSLTTTKTTSFSSTPPPRPPRPQPATPGPASQSVSNTANNYVAPAPTSPQRSFSSTSPPYHQSATPRPASQIVRNSANKYVIPAATAAREPENITPRQGQLIAKLLVCPQYNGRGCVAQPCRRLHVCYHWATKTCNRKTCKHDHSLNSPHNRRLLEASQGRNSMRHLEVSEIIKKDKLPLSKEEGPQICSFNVLKRCTRNPCDLVHCAKKYLWEVQDCSKWIQLSFNQSDYLELMYSHPSEECVALIPLKPSLSNNRNLKRLTTLLAKEASWTVDLEAMKLKGGSSVLDIRRLSTTSDLSSQIPVATRWMWYWQGDDGCWEPYGEGVINGHYYIALGDCLEFFLRILKKKFVTVSVGSFCYSINGEKMTQTNQTTNKVRNIRRRPACSLVSQESVVFDELFLPLPASKKFLKLPVLPPSSEFIFVENLLKQTLTEVKVSSMHRVQNDHLWRVYQNKKLLLTSLYNGDVTATNEQYLFHGTGPEVIDLICQENLDWKLSGTNVGCLYGQGTCFSNLASLAHQYARSDMTGKRMMLVVLVVVGKMTRGCKEMTLPPENKASGRTYDTTCDSDTSATIFVKYHKDEYYPAYIVRYSCDSF